MDGVRARARAYERIREEIAKGRQCFVVCPLVEESEALQAKAATVEAERLAATEFREQRVALIHGQMPTAEKAEAMRSFAAGEADVLVATSVVEVGIDVPNATVMLIEAAERYGLSQLHQLRGRVGRGEHESRVHPLRRSEAAAAEAIASERDGFASPRSTSSCAARARCSAPARAACPSSAWRSCPRTGAAREGAGAGGRLLDADPASRSPSTRCCASAVVARFGSELDPIPA